MKRFHELVVVEFAGSVAGSYAGKLFADLGAPVLKVEPTDGDPQRADGEPLPRMGTLFAALNTGKESVCLNLHAADGNAALARLLVRADLVIESSSPEPLSPVTLAADHSPLVKLYLSPFGLTGPYAGFRSTPFTDYAAGGHMYLNGEPDREPLQGAGRQAEYAAGVYGFIGAMAALWAREATGRGQTVDVSHMEAMASLHQWTTVRYTHGGYVQRRTGNRYDSTHPITIYPCKDGHVGISAASDLQGERLLAVAGLIHLLDDPRFATGVARLQHADAFDATLLPWLMAHTVAEIVEICQAARVPAGPVPTMLELLRDEHLAARRFWTVADEPKPVASPQPPGGSGFVSGRASTTTPEARTGSAFLGGPDSLRYPGPPFRLSRHAWSLRRAPELGASTAAVLRELEGEGGSTTSAVTRQADATDDGRAWPPHDGPLTGVLVLDLSRVWAGPLAARILADLGADVIRVEALGSRGPRRVREAVVQQSRRYPENQAGARPWNREGMFNKFNRNKRAVTLQLDTPRGKALFEELVRRSDVVLENYSPRVMPQLGLGYERLRALNPGIIYVGMPGFGWDGPARDYVAYGTMLEPAAGLSSLMGYPDTGPYKSGVAWADPVAGLHGAAAVLVALWDRRADPEGRGQAIELAQIEAMINFICEEVLAAQARGHDRPRFGNHHPTWAPQGCYPCAGEDRWIAISVRSDAEWTTLCRLASFGPDLTRLRVEERQAAHDVIDAVIATWTAQADQMELMYRLQAHGIAAVAVLDARQLVEDPHLAARRFFVPLTHPDAGTYPFPGLPIHLSATPATFRRPAPGLGQHNEEVFAGILGLTAMELKDLRAAGVIGEEPPG